ncbi:hypothetical protein PY650_13720 [Rhizobium calliandrae]|uniref:Uncharacterized protein n=1 Tax=Rhizobium calliandrae TaxID=1312182 RepID=A0ABT7KFB3_9HYPH|nr:hypothetical protein [Rhizobium calliandrae]MDL2406700.1 hypothetical protein [Rhizobium calliandrae]
MPDPRCEKSVPCCSGQLSAEILIIRMSVARDFVARVRLLE